MDAKGTTPRGDAQRAERKAVITADAVEECLRRNGSMTALGMADAIVRGRAVTDADHRLVAERLRALEQRGRVVRGGVVPSTKSTGGRPATLWSVLPHT